MRFQPAQGKLWQEVHGERCSQAIGGSGRKCVAGVKNTPGCAWEEEASRLSMVSARDAREEGTYSLW